MTGIKLKHRAPEPTWIPPLRSWIPFVLTLVLVPVLVTTASAAGTVPRLDSITPASGPLTGGTIVTLYGAHFDNPSDAINVYFGDVRGYDFLFVNDKKNIQITTPPSTTAGSVIVRVENVNGNSTGTSVLFTYTEVPGVTGLSPNIGPTTGGTTVIITGYNLDGATAVMFGSTPATSYTVNYNTQITAVAPAGSGTVDVRVSVGSDTSPVVAADQFTYAASPTITDITPSTGTTAGGTSVVITGVNFLGATSVTFGGTAASVSGVTDTAISVTTPARTTGTVTVSVVTPNGTATMANAFTYTATPTITDVTPTTVGTSGGTIVTLTGANLMGATSVTFGGVAATGVTVVNSTMVQATTPAYAAGTVTVSVVTPNGTANKYSAFTFAPPLASITLDKTNIPLSLVTDQTATDNSLGIYVNANVPWRITVADNTGRPSNLGKMGSYTSGVYDATGPALTNYLNLAGTPYGGTINTHTINPPITATPQTLYSGNAIVGQYLAPNTFSQKVEYTDSPLRVGSEYRIDLIFTIAVT